MMVLQEKGKVAKPHICTSVLYSVFAVVSCCVLCKCAVFSRGTEYQSVFHTAAPLSKNVFTEKLVASSKATGSDYVERKCETAAPFGHGIT